MVDPAPNRDSDVSTAAPRPPGQAVSRATLVAFAIALAGVVAAAWFTGYEAQQELRIDVAKHLTEADAALAQAKTREAALANDLRDAQAKLALLDTRVSESQSQQASLEALYRELAPSRDELALNEVEQVLLLASQQLAIAGNVQAALAALQLADAKLARVDRPQLVPLRRALARDIDRLKSVPVRRRRRHVAQARPGHCAGRLAAARAGRAAAAAGRAGAAEGRGGVAEVPARRVGGGQVARARSRLPTGPRRRWCRRRSSISCARTCACAS